jgi:uncharacterized Zn finger protein
MQCPECGEWFISATVWSQGDPDPVPGVLCPHCGTFIADEHDRPTEEAPPPSETDSE